MSIRFKKDVIYGGVKLSVEGNIDKVFVENTNIYDLFSVMDLEEIVELVLEELED